MLDPQIRTEIQNAVNQGNKKITDHLLNLEESFRDIQIGQDDIKKIATAFSTVIIQNGIGNRHFTRSEFDTLIYKDMKIRPTQSQMDEKFLKYKDEIMGIVDKKIDDAPAQKLNKYGKMFRDWKEILLVLSMIVTWFFLLVKG